MGAGGGRRRKVPPWWGEEPPPIRSTDEVEAGGGGRCSFREWKIGSRTNVRCHSVLIDRRSEQHKLHAAEYTRRTPDRYFNNRITSVLITIKSWEHNLRSEVVALSWTIFLTQDDEGESRKGGQR